MATFLNESVLSLPEQVEKNKNDIKEIEETIGGIEPDLVNQVHTNTSDISAIKQEQTLQNTAINNNTNKTQNINANGTKYSNVEEIKNELAPIQIKGNGISIENDDITEIFTPNANIVIANNGVVEIKNDNNANKLKYNMANGDFTVEGSHVLQYSSATGSLTIDGSGIGKTYYNHSVTIAKLSGNPRFVNKITIINTSNTPLVKADIVTWFKANGYDKWDGLEPVNNYTLISMSDTNDTSYYGFAYATSSNDISVQYRANASGGYSSVTLDTVSDSVTLIN